MTKRPTQDDILRKVTEHYLTSRDFNGLPLGRIILESGIDEDALKRMVASLIQAGKISLYFGELHDNPHIKRFTELPKEKQIEALRGADLSHACAYPSKARLRRIVKPSAYNDRPFTLRLALGEHQLSFQAFDVSVLEFYRNEPRYYYFTDDMSGQISVRDVGRRMKASDKVLLQSFGFAYDSKMNRAVAVYLRYLSGLSPEHQRIWEAKALRGEYRLHPDYARSTVGDWDLGISIFDAFLGEIRHINAMCKLMGRPPLFKKEFNEGAKPRGFGFVIRPTLKEFNDFTHLLDKLLSDNVNKDFFMNDVTAESEQERADGKIEVRSKGTIQMLVEWLKKNVRLRDQKPFDEAITAMKEVRQLRQRPAHAIEEDRFDQSYFHRQREIMIRAYAAVRTLRLLFANHPKVRGYEVPEPLKTGDKIRTF